MTDVTIEIRNKTHHGAQTPTIENFSLSLGAGEFVCLVGQSGCGKTTLLNSIAGLDANYVGNIRLSNTTQSPKIGYVFQQPCLLLGARFMKILNWPLHRIQIIKMRMLKVCSILCS